jgi:hypothetical protein
MGLFGMGLIWYLPYLAWAFFGMGLIWHGHYLAWALFGMDLIWHGPYLAWALLGATGTGMSLIAKWIFHQNPVNSLTFQSVV